MLRDPQHERKIINDCEFSPFVPSIDSGRALIYACPEPSRRVEGLRGSFSAACFREPVAGKAVTALRVFGEAYRQARRQRTIRETSYEPDAA